MAAPFSIPTSIFRVPVSPDSCHCSHFLWWWWQWPSKWLWRGPRVVLICISLITNDTNSLLHANWMFIYLFGDKSTQVICPLKMHFALLSFNCKSSSYSLDTRLLSVHDHKYFLQFHELSFNFLNSTPWNLKLFNVDEVYLFFRCYTSGVPPKITLTNLK